MLYINKLYYRVCSGKYGEDAEWLKRFGCKNM